MKAIMLSIRPEWVEKILNGEKILEIRTTCPKEWKNYLSGKAVKPKPMKCYLYCTKTKKTGNAWTDGDVLGFDSYRKIRFCNYCQYEDIMNGRVVAEFTLKEISLIECDSEQHKKYYKDSCLTQDDFITYCNGQDLYAWHIDDLKIYDKPKELSKFRTGKKKAFNCGYGNYNIYEQILERPFQSWGYVEEIGGNNE